MSWRTYRPEAKHAWDRPEVRPTVRQNFDKVTKCGTLALGAEIYASENEEKAGSSHLQGETLPRRNDPHHRVRVQLARVG